MKYILMALTILTISSCMKSKDDYQKAISEIQEEQEAEGDREIQRKVYREEQIQREEAIERNEQRSRGSNDAEGMGMDE